MRRQYHSRRTGNGVYTWDIHRLVELSRDLPVIKVSLGRIREIDENYWFQGDTVPTCREIVLHARLIGETDDAHPIILCGEGRVMDGMHRVCRALMLGRDTIRAVRFEKTPDPDYVDVDPEKLPYDEPW